MWEWKAVALEILGASGESALGMDVGTDPCVRGGCCQKQQA